MNPEKPEKGAENELAKGKERVRLGLEERGISAPEATRVAAEIYNRALELDGIIQEFMSDQKNMDFYEFDGEKLKSRRGGEANIVYGGEGMMKLVADAYLDVYAKQGSAEDLMKVVGAHVGHARKFLVGWREFMVFMDKQGWPKDFSAMSVELLPEETKREILEDYEEQMRMHPAWEEFFKENEAQMAEHLKKNPIKKQPE
ncbi:MAG: hypothetical protein AAB897_00065 [Patescibacteria group bacterium]